MSTEVATLEQQGLDLVPTILALTVVDEESFGRAGEMAHAIVEYIARVEQVLGPIVTATNHAHKVAVAQRDGLLKPAQGAKRALADRMAGYEQEQARLRREAEDAIRRERERLEAEARAQAEAEQRRLQAEAEAQRRQAAAGLEAIGETGDAARVLAAPVAVPTVVAAPVVMPSMPAMAPPPRIDGVSFRDDWDFEIENVALLPRDYLVPDEKKIRAVVKTLKAATNIPGVRVIHGRAASVRR